MRHRKISQRFGRRTEHRQSMFKNQVISLLTSPDGRIKTTVPKAKYLRRIAEPLITLAKTDTVANRRLAFARLGNKFVVGELFTKFGPKYASRPGGYLRILKCGYRLGDAAPMAYVSLV